MSELEPCPFCGSKPKCREPNVPPIFCVSCGVQPMTVEGLSWEQAIAAWNRRAAHDHARIEAQAALIAELTEAAKKLRDDMQNRAEMGMDVIRGEQYRVVNAGNTAWTEFIEVLARAEEAQK